MKENVRTKDAEQGGQGVNTMDGAQADLGLIGLGVMGRNLLYNMADHGFNVFGLDQSDEKVEEALKDGDHKKVRASTSVDELIASLKKPRAILLLVPAGRPVDAVIDELKDRLDPGDLIIDGGNSHFTDTDRRAKALADKRIDFLGVGISGGSEGARRGPSMMPGGPEPAYERVRSIFEAAAAKVDGEPCVTYLGPGSAGHYVKMVHNGIEYAVMELIAEVYDILKRIGKLSNDELAEVFEKWHEGPLSSFLIEITAKIFRVPDEDTNQRLVDMILDAARQKGTGKWASQSAMELQVPIPTIDTAVSMRDLSAFKLEREAAAKVFPPWDTEYNGDRQHLIDRLAVSLRFGMIVSYAQGMSLLRTASGTYNYGLNLAGIASIWRGGCIIRAEMLKDIRKAFQAKPDLANLMIAKPFSDTLHANRDAVVEMIALATKNGIPVPGLSSALGYFDAYRTFRLPANLIQAQRDFFGSHTYERIDREGITYHTDWE